jgi:hypothetical protein
MAGLDSLEKESEGLWKKLTFTDAREYIWQSRLKHRKKVIGYVNEEKVIVQMVGHVETHDLQDEDGDFFGRCELAIPGQSVMHGFILGSFYRSGTALIIGQDDKVYAYSPENAIDYPWKLMKSEGAEIEIDSEHNIIVRDIPRMIVTSLAEW